jgi:shikimate dehydrogenase
MPDLYAVIGNPIAQSKSPIIHTMFAEACGHTISYERIEAPLGKFAETVDAFRARGGRGINITAPFKLDAFAYATRASDAARIAGAANAMKFDGDTVEAENFDGIGLVRDIVANLGVAIRGKRVLFLGAGGATRGALQPFLAEAPSEIVIANRNLQKAHSLVNEVTKNSNVIACDYASLASGPTSLASDPTSLASDPTSLASDPTSLASDPMSLANRSFDIVVNATSASLTHASPPISSTLFNQCTLACELAYGKGLTPFLKLAKEGGAAQLADGVGMLVEQAAEAFAWWRGVRPKTQAVIDALRVPLA